MNEDDFGKDIGASADYIYETYNNPLVTHELAIELVPVIKNQLNFCQNLQSIIDFSSFLTKQQVERVFMEDLSYFSAKEQLTLEEKIDKIIENDDNQQLFKINSDAYLFFNPTKE